MVPDATTPFCCATRIAAAICAGSTLSQAPSPHPANGARKPWTRARPLSPRPPPGTLPTCRRRVAYPVAVGALAARHRIEEDATAAAYLQAFTTNLISAAVRLVPLGQSTGLRILAGLEAVILTVACETRTATLDDIGGCAFRADLAAMHHETQYTRLFRS